MALAAMSSIRRRPSETTLNRSLLQEDSCLISKEGDDYIPDLSDVIDEILDGNISDEDDINELYCPEPPPSSSKVAKNCSSDPFPMRPLSGGGSRSSSPRGVANKSPAVFDKKFHPLPHQGTSIKTQGPLEACGGLGSHIIRAHSLTLLQQSVVSDGLIQQNIEPQQRVPHIKRRKRECDVKNMRELQQTSNSSKSSAQGFNDFQRSGHAEAVGSSFAHSDFEPIPAMPAKLLEIKIGKGTQTIADINAPLFNRRYPVRAPLLKQAYWRLKDMKLICRWNEQQQGLVVLGYDIDFATEFQYSDPWQSKHYPDVDSCTYPDFHGHLLRTLAEGTQAKNAELEFQKFDRAASRNTAHSGFLNLKTSGRSTVAVYMKISPLQPSKRIQSSDASAPVAATTSLPSSESEASSEAGSEGGKNGAIASGGRGKLFMVRIEATTDRGYIKTFEMFMKKYSDKDQVKQKSRRKQSQNRAKRSKGRKTNLSRLEPQVSADSDEATKSDVSIQDEPPPNNAAFLASSVFQEIIKKEIGVAPRLAAKTSNITATPDAPISPRTMDMLEKFLPPQKNGKTDNESQPPSSAMATASSPCRKQQAVGQENDMLLTTPLRDVSPPEHAAPPRHKCATPHTLIL